MSEFKFPENCSYCTQTYKTEHCTLPYYLVKSFVLPTEPTLKAIELTKLHCAYHFNTINELVSTANWHLQSQSNSRANSSTHESLHSFVYNPDISSVISTSSEAGVRLPETDLTAVPTAEELTSSLDTQQLDTKLTELNLATASSKAQEQEKHSVPTTEATQATSFNPSAIMHLTQDLSLAAITATNLRKIKRTSLTALEFRNTLSSEIETLLHLKDKYHHRSETKLDHPIALSREIVSSHSNDQLTDWLGTTKTGSIPHSGCILNYLPFTINDEPNSSKRLDNCLIRFSKLSLTNPSIPPDKLKLAHHSTKEIISERGYPTIFDWLKKTKEPILYQNDPSFLPTITESPTSSKSKTLPDSKGKEKHLCPPTDPKTSKVLNDHLDSFVENLLLSKDFVTMPPTKIGTHSTLLTSLAAEMIRHNPHWTKAGYIPTSQQLTQAASTLGLPLPSNFKDPLLWNLMTIIHGLAKLA
jgi:hypothetical protein